MEPPVSTSPLPHMTTSPGFSPWRVPSTPDHNAGSMPAPLECEPAARTCASNSRVISSRSTAPSPKRANSKRPHLTIDVAHAPASKSSSMRGGSALRPTAPSSYGCTDIERRQTTPCSISDAAPRCQHGASPSALRPKGAAFAAAISPSGAPHRAGVAFGSSLPSRGAFGAGAAAQGALRGQSRHAAPGPLSVTLAGEDLDWGGSAAPRHAPSHALAAPGRMMWALRGSSWADGSTCSQRAGGRSGSGSNTGAGSGSGCSALDPADALKDADEGASGEGGGGPHSPSGQQQREHPHPLPHQHQGHAGVHAAGEPYVFGSAPGSAGGPGAHGRAMPAPWWLHAFAGPLPHDQYSDPVPFSSQLRCATPSSPPHHTFAQPPSPRRVASVSSPTSPHVGNGGRRFRRATCQSGAAPLPQNHAQSLASHAAREPGSMTVGARCWTPDRARDTPSPVQPDLDLRAASWLDPATTHGSAALGQQPYEPPPARSPQAPSAPPTSASAWLDPPAVTVPVPRLDLAALRQGLGTRAGSGAMPMSARGPLPFSCSSFIIPPQRASSPALMVNGTPLVGAEASGAGPDAEAPGGSSGDGDGFAEGELTPHRRGSEEEEGEEEDDQGLGCGRYHDGVGCDVDDDIDDDDDLMEGQAAGAMGPGGPWGAHSEWQDEGRQVEEGAAGGHPQAPGGRVPPPPAPAPELLSGSAAARQLAKVRRHPGLAPTAPGTGSAGAPAAPHPRPHPLHEPAPEPTPAAGHALPLVASPRATAAPPPRPAPPAAAAAAEARRSGAGSPIVRTQRLALLQPRSVSLRGLTDAGWVDPGSSAPPDMRGGGLAAAAARRIQGRDGTMYQLSIQQLRTREVMARAN